MIEQTNEFSAEEAHDLLHDLAAGICYRSDGLSIETIPAGSNGTRLILRAHRAEFGKLIGKGGAHVKALVCVFREIGEATGGGIFLNLPEPDQASKTYESGLKNDFAPEKIQDLIWRTVEPVNPNALVQVIPIDAGSTAYEVTPARGFSEEFRESVRVLFNALGRAYGQMVEVSFVD